MHEPPLVSIVILTHNKVKYTRACLESILRTRGTGFEVIVVDNGSTDETLEYLAGVAPVFREHGAELSWQANGRNVGCCTGRNQGMARARGRFFVFMDNDVMVVEGDWLERLRRAIEADPRAGFAGPKLIYPVEPHLIQCAGVGVSRSGRIQFRGRGCARNDPRFAQPREVQCLISACYMFRREIYDTLGGLDEAFNPIEFEDFDFCYRARAAGWRCLYEPSVEMYHWESITSEGTERLPNTYLIIKHGLLFKERWRHLFEKEDGPADSECRWTRLRMTSLDGERTR